jgi:transposase
MKITTIGIDLAKSVFQIHGVDGHGKTLLKKQIKRSEMATFFSNIPPVSSAWKHVAEHITGPVSS